jgi:hypothetical protein
VSSAWFARSRCSPTWRPGKSNPETSTDVVLQGRLFNPSHLGCEPALSGLGQRRKRSQRYTALMSTDPNMTGNPNLKNCQNEMG